MAQYPKPTSNTGTFNNQSFVNPDNQGGLTVEEGLKYFVSFPVTQSPSNITANNFTTTGFLNVAGTSQFGGDATFIGGATITGPLSFSDDIIVEGTVTVDQSLLALSTADIDGELTVNNNIILDYNPAFPLTKTYIQFSDNTIQDTAFIEANYAQLNTANEFLTGFTQTFSGPVILNGNTTLGTSLNMNTNNISGANVVGANSLTISSTNLPLVPANNTGIGQTIGQTYFNNNTPYVNNPSFSFHINGAGGFQSVLNLTPDGSILNSPLDMNSFGITECASINAAINNYVTTTSPPDGDNTTKIATTAWVNTNSSSPVLTNYAQLTYPDGAFQTFTTPINFSSSLQSNSVTVATLNDLPFNTTTIISRWPLSPTSFCSLSSGFTQESQALNISASAQSFFYNNPFTFAINISVSPLPVGSPIFYIQFTNGTTTNVKPWPNFPPPAGTYIVLGFSSTGQTFNIPTTFTIESGIYYIMTLGSTYNMAVDTSITVNLASLGLIPA